MFDPKSRRDSSCVKRDWMFSNSPGKLSKNANAPSGPFRHSIPAGDLVLCNPPPYGTQPWPGSGVVLHYGLLSEVRLRARVVRPSAPPFSPPPSIFEATSRTFLSAPSMASIFAEDPGYFDAMVGELLLGGEQVYGLCVFRNNVDALLWLARLLKERKPDSFIIIGGPEAVEAPLELRLPWVDAVVGAKAESVIVPLVEKVLAGRPEQAGNLPNAWLHSRFKMVDSDPLNREPLPTPEYPRIDYGPLVRLLIGDSEPAMHLQLSDNTTNALPALFDELMRGITVRQSDWGKAHVRGQSLVDARITEERVRLMFEARFDLIFFGLETASDDFRRRLSKPARIAKVAEAMKVIHRYGVGQLRVNLGVPVSIPGETETDFEETLRFVDWAMQFREAIASVTVLPYLFFLTTHDSTLNENNTGERRGLMWKMAFPGGEPAVRARRYMRVFETIDRRVEGTSLIPPCLALPAMLPTADPEGMEAWLSTYGRKLDELTPGKIVDSAIPESTDPMVAVLWSAITSRFNTAIFLGRWGQEGFGRISTDGGKSLIVLFRQEVEQIYFALRFDPPDRELSAFAHHPEFYLRYLENWIRLECVYEQHLMGFCMPLLDNVSSECEPRSLEAEVSTLAS